MSTAKFELLLALGLSALAVGLKPVSGQWDGPWKMHVIDDSSRGADGVRLGDFNRDQLADIVTGWEEGGVIRVYQNPGPGKTKNKWPAVTVGRVKSPEDAVFADLDLDGKPDWVHTSNTRFLPRPSKVPGIHWIKTSGGKFVSRPIGNHVSKKYDRIELLDLDADGDLDVLTCEEAANLGVIWFENPAR